LDAASSASFSERAENPGGCAMSSFFSSFSNRSRSSASSMASGLVPQILTIEPSPLEVGICISFSALSRPLASLSGVWPPNCTTTFRPGRESVRDGEGDTVGYSVRETVREDTVGETVRDTVGDTVGDTVRETVGDTVRDTVRETARESTYTMIPSGRSLSTTLSTSSRVKGSKYRRLEVS
jgi:hypothetical protein